MKIRINIDVSPEEARSFFGLPDVRTFQDELFDRMREQMHAGAEGFDPISLMQPFLAWNLQNLETMRKAFSGRLDPQKDDDSA